MWRSSQSGAGRARRRRSGPGPAGRASGRLGGANTVQVVLATESRSTRGAVASLPQVGVRDLHAVLDAGDLVLLDVRQPAEWAAGHIAGAVVITGAEWPRAPGRGPGGPAGRCDLQHPLPVLDAASLLAGHRRTTVCRVLGGMAAWTAAGYPTTTD